MKCPNCGVENLVGTERCKNCEMPLKQYEIKNNVQINKSKNSVLIVLFNILTCFIIPIFLFLTSISNHSGQLLGLKIILIILAALIHMSGECISCLVTIKIVKNKENICKTLSWYDLGALICYIPLFYWGASNEISHFWILILLVIFKFISYILTVKFILKEKIRMKIFPIIILAICYIFVFSIPNLKNPTNINKNLYRVFGSNDFDSKELKIKLVDEYNEEDNYTGNDISYFHKFTDRELENITDLEINKKLKNVTIKDLSKLKNLQSLSIVNLKIRNEFNLSSNKKLTILNLENVSFSKNLIIDSNSNIKEIHVDNSIFKDIKINSNNLIKMEAEKSKVNNITINNSLGLKEFYFIKSNINNVTIDGNKNLRSLGLSKTNNITIKNMGNINDFFKLYKDQYGYSFNEYLMFKKLVFDNKKISFKNDEYIKFNGYLYVKENSLVKDLLLENLTAKVFDNYHEIIKRHEDGSVTYDSESKIKEQGPDSGLGDEIHLYENDEEVLYCDIFKLDKYDMEDN